MKATLSKITAKVWLLMSYAMLAGLLYWSANHVSTYFTNSVFGVCLLASWVPAYVYSNRREMKQNRVFWISHGAALAAVVIVTCLLLPWLSEDRPSSNSSSSPWGGIFGGFVAYMATQSMFASIVTRCFSFTESTVEKFMVKKPDDVKR